MAALPLDPLLTSIIQLGSWGLVAFLVYWTVRYTIPKRDEQFLTSAEKRDAQFLASLQQQHTELLALAQKQEEACEKRLDRIQADAAAKLTAIQENAAQALRELREASEHRLDVLSAAGAQQTREAQVANAAQLVEQRTAFLARLEAQEKIAWTEFHRHGDRTSQDMNLLSASIRELGEVILIQRGRAADWRALPPATEGQAEIPE